MDMNSNAGDPQQAMLDAAMLDRASQGGDGWHRRTVHGHEHRGHRWTIAVDWAESGSAVVPASITLTSVGATFGHDIVGDPVPVTRSLIDSIRWSDVIWRGREQLKCSAERLPAIVEAAGFEIVALGSPPEAFDPPQRKTRALDDTLQLVAREYAAAGGSNNPRVARAVQAALELAGVRPQRRGPRPSDGEVSLRPEQVRRWISQARERGYIAPDD